jgi:large subunit ribosomal protein L4e
MKAKIRSITGTEVGDITLPEQFFTVVRPDLVRRAVLAINSHKKQPYGSKPGAGMRASSKLSRRRRDYKTAYGHGISRVPRKIMSHSGTRFNWVGSQAPNTVGGRRAHPPKAGKIISQKINNKERKKAVLSALAASVNKDMVAKRGHIFTDYPIIIEDSFENIKKTKEVIDALVKNGLEKELARSEKKKVREGKGKARGRKYRIRKGPLLVVSKNCDVVLSARNIPGVDVSTAKDLNALLLAPGGSCGRLTVYTKGAIEYFNKDKMEDKPKKTRAKKKE